MPEDLTPSFHLLPASLSVVLPTQPNDAGSSVVGGFMASPNGLSQGNLSLNGTTETILVGKATAPSTGVGVFVGNAGDNTYDFRAGDPANAYIWWDASAGTLTVAGTITATAGAIGGFTIGADYVRDAANSFGLASTVTAGDDVRFWAGAAFASRATAPFFLTESGAVTATNIVATGTINAQGGYLGAPTTVLNISTSGLDIGTTGHIQGGQSAYNTGTGFFIGYSGAAYKLSIGNPSGDFLTWDGTKLATNKFVLTGIGAFGGDSSDGALAVSSGTTTIDLANAAYVVKNYSSISITGTGAIQFINPHANGSLIVIKSRGDVTLTSSATPMIDASKCGAVGGAAVTASGLVGGASGVVAGNDGNDGMSYSILFSAPGHGGKGQSPDSAGTAGAAVSFALQTAMFTNSQIFNHYQHLWTAAGGGSGNIVHSGSSAWGGTTGKGGNGGGTLIIECAGAWNFTTASGISVAGENGGDASNQTGTSVAVAGGGAGAGGYFLCLYNTLTANSGTVTKAGGTGGKTLVNNSVDCSGGGSGANVLSAGNPGTSTTSTGTQNGANGPVGASLIAQNTFFA